MKEKVSWLWLNLMHKRENEMTKCTKREVVEW
jgi:hypothetical protein